MNPLSTMRLASVLVLFSLALVACDTSNEATPVASDQFESTTTQKTGGTSPVLLADVRLEGRLTATAADPLASGTAKWESRPDRITFSCEVEDVTTTGDHEVRVNGVTVGFVNVVAGFGDLNMDSRNGDAVPTMNAGDRVQVRNPSGRVILRGTLALN
jgi:hypothetical protein